MKNKSVLLLVGAALALAGCGGMSPTSSDSGSASSQSISPSSEASQSQSSKSEESSSSFSSEESISTLESSSKETSSSSEESFTSEESSISSDKESSSEEPMSSSSSESSSTPERDPSSLYGGYYKDLVSWRDGEDLKQQLHEIISGGTYTPIPYAGSMTNWESNRVADQDLYDHEFLDVVYSSNKIDKDGTNSQWQREHAFCASLMTGSLTSDAVKYLGRATDFHNLFASYSSANSSRGNKNYGEANKADETYQDRTTNSGKDGYSFDAEIFEPGDIDKGRLSRAIFYMATMYCEDETISGIPYTMKALKIVEEDVDYKAGSSCAFSIGHLSTLLSWSHYDVDLLEYQHNESVYSFVPQIHSDPSHDVAQGNRNPYVDFPELVDYAFGDKKDEPGELKDIISSYETLDIAGEGLSHYAIREARRKYDPTDTFSKEDVKVVAVSKDLSEADALEFNVKGVSETEPFGNAGIISVDVETELNTIHYDISVISDHIESALWKHKVTAKSAGNDFYGIEAQKGVVHTLDFDGVDMDVYWKSGSVQSNSAKLGCKFGKAGEGVDTLSFETHEAFEYEGCSNVDSIYIRGATASGCTYNVDFYVEGAKVAHKTISYAGQDATSDIGVVLDEPLQGKVSIVLTNVTNAVYIQYIAINAF